MTDVRSTGGGGGEAAEGHDLATDRELLEKGEGRLDLGTRRATVRRRRPRMRRNDIPEQDVLAEPELRERALDDRRGRLGRTTAGELALRRERDAADPGAAISGRLADDQERRLDAALEIREEASAEELRAGVLVERRPDPRLCESLYELQRFQWTSSSIGRRGRDARLERSGGSSQAGWPTVRTQATPTCSGIPSRSLNAGSRSAGTP